MWRNRACTQQIKFFDVFQTKLKLSPTTPRFAQNSSIFSCEGGKFERSHAQSFNVSYGLLCVRVRHLMLPTFPIWKTLFQKSVNIFTKHNQLVWVHKPLGLLLWSFFLLINGEVKNSLAVFLFPFPLFPLAITDVRLESFSLWLLLFRFRSSQASSFAGALSTFVASQHGSICSGICCSLIEKLGLLGLGKISLESKLFDFPNFFSCWLSAFGLAARCLNRLCLLLLASFWLLTRINLQDTN